MDHRCTPASLASGEPLLGTAPADAAWLLVEHDAPWGAKALAESALPEEVRATLGALEGVRVQLVRRHGRAGRGPGGVRVLTAQVGASGPARVGAGRLDDVREVLDLDLAALAAGREHGLPRHDGPLWLVCTNGRRDLCCADLGRPVAAALAERWPEATWETTHLGGHRFAATLLALPTGLALGRLGPGSAVAACEALEAGAGDPSAAALEPVGPVLRGHGARSGPAQVAEAAVLDPAAALAALGPAGPLAPGGPVVPEVDGAPAAASPGETTRVRASAPDGTAYDVEVRTSPGEPRRQSCADLAEKSAPEHRLAGLTRVAPG